jgi:hypothetical protein
MRGYDRFRPLIKRELRNLAKGRFPDNLEFGRKFSKQIEQASLDNSDQRLDKKTEAELKAAKRAARRQDTGKFGGGGKGGVAKNAAAGAGSKHGAMGNINSRKNSRKVSNQQKLPNLNGGDPNLVYPHNTGNNRDLRIPSLDKSGRTTSSEPHPDVDAKSDSKGKDLNFLTHYSAN